MPDEKDFLDKTHEDGVVSSLEYVEYLDNYVPPTDPLYLDMPEFDRETGGVLPGELWILSGVSKHGKSTFMRSMIRNYLAQDALSMVFSFEERPQEFFQKFHNNARDLLFYVPRIRVAYDIEEMFDRAREARDKFGVRVMFIDSGQKLVHDVQQSSSLAHVVGDLASRLKLFAEEEDLIIWLIWHLKKDDDVTLQNLSASYLRDSGRLYQECDGLVFMYRDVKSNGISKVQENWIKVYSTRRSGAFEALIPVIKKGEYFKELDVEDI